MKYLMVSALALMTVPALAQEAVIVTDDTTAAPMTTTQQPATTTAPMATMDHQDDTTTSMVTTDPVTTTAPTSDTMMADPVTASTASGGVEATMIDQTMAHDGMISAGQLEDVDVYALDLNGATAWDRNVTYDRIDTNWDNLGEVEDIILDSNGQMVGILVEVGGFLGIGEKNVMVANGDYKFVSNDGDLAIVVGYTSEQLEQAPDMRERFDD